MEWQEQALRFGGTVLIAVITMLVLGWVRSRTTDQRLVGQEGIIVLRPARWFGMLGILAAAIGCAFIAAPFLIGLTGTTGLLITGITSLIGLFLFLLPGILLWLIHRNHRVWYSADSVLVTDVLGREQGFTLGQVTNGRLLRVSHDIQLVLNDGRRVRISGYLVGARQFLENVQERTGLPALTWAKGLG